MKALKYVFLSVFIFLTASCSGSGGGDTVPANDEGQFPSNVIGLWNLGGSLYVKFSAPFRAESWALDDLQNCFYYDADVLTPLGGNDYRDSAGDVASISVSANDNLLDFGYGNDSFSFSRVVGIDSSDLTICSLNFSANAAQHKVSGFFEHLL